MFTFFIFRGQNLDENSCVIWFKRLNLKKDNSDSTYKQKLISRFFLPGFLPIYATIPKIFKQNFEDNFEVKRDSLNSIVNGKLNINKEFVIDQLIAQLEVDNNMKFTINNFSNIIKIMTKTK